MRSTARQTRENRTITIDSQNEATYMQLLGDGKAFLECVLAFVMSLGFQLKHKGDLWRRWMPHAPRIMSVCGWVGSPSGGSSALHVSGLHHPPAFHLALPPDATRVARDALLARTVASVWNSAR